MIIVPFKVPLEGVNDSCTLFSPLEGGELQLYLFQSPWMVQMIILHFSVPLEAVNDNCPLFTQLGGGK